MLEDLLSIAAKSLIRHAVVGVLTGGVGNVLLLAGDAMDVMDVMDATDVVNAVSSTDTGCSYGGHMPNLAPNFSNLGSGKSIAD